MTEIKIDTQVLNNIIDMLNWLNATPECAKMSIVDRMWDQLWEMWMAATDAEADELELKEGKLFALIDGNDIQVVGK